MIVIEQYTVKQRYCDCCGCKEEADNQALPDFSDSFILSPPNFLDRFDLCPLCYYHYQHEQGLV